MAGLKGFWKGEHTYHVYDPVTGRNEDVTIPTTTQRGRIAYAKTELEELEHFAREWVEKSWKAEDKEPALVTLTRPQQHDLGTVLMDIKMSRIRRESVGHGRYW